MKKFLAAVGLMAGFIVLAGSAKAATTQSLLLKVTATGNKSLTLSTGTYDFGSVALGVNGTVTSSVTVSNNGTIPETFGMRISAGDSAAIPWTVVAGNVAVGNDTFHLKAAFNDGLSNPVAAGFDTTTGTEDDVRQQAGADVATATAFYASGATNGVGVIPATARGLYFDLDMPATSSSATGTLHTFTVEVSAN